MRLCAATDGWNYFCKGTTLGIIEAHASKSLLLEDVRPEDGGQRPDVPALLLKGSHAGQEAAQETQQAVVQLGKLLQQVLQVSTQFLFVAVI